MQLPPPQYKNLTRALYWAGLFYLLLLVYWPSLEAPFLYDDIPNIVQNEDFTHSGNFAKLFTSHSTSLQFDHRPLAGLVSLANYQFSGLNVVAYRVTNIVIHWLSAVLIGEFIILYALRFGFTWIRPFALIAGYFWTLHPINSVTVIFISQRMESLMTLFYLLSLFSLLKAHPESKQPLRWLVLAALSSILCLASKEVGVSLIASFLLLDRMSNFDSWRNLFRLRWGFYLTILSFWTVFIVWWSKGERIAELGGNELSHPWNYLKMQAKVIIHYIRIVIWPEGLVFVHQPLTPAGLFQWLPQMLALCGLLFVTVKSYKSHSWAVFPGLLFFIALSPTSSILPIPQEPAAEWRMYLPSACIIAFVLALGYKLLPRFFAPKLTAASVILLGLTLAVCTSIRCLDYRSPITIWADTVQKQPHNFKGWLNLGGSYLQAGQVKEAEGCANVLEQMAILQNDRISLSASYQLRGKSAMIQAKHQEAEHYFLEGLRHYPYRDKLQHLSLLIDLGKVQLAQNKKAEAASVFEKALELSPNRKSLLMLLQQTKTTKSKPFNSDEPSNS